jgi:hypothetical protein
MCDVSGRRVSAPGAPHPRWSLLYGQASLMLGGLATVEVVSPPGAWRTVLRCGIGLAGFAAMAAWARWNRVALDQQDWCECAAEKITMRVIPSRRPEPTATEPREPFEALEELPDDRWTLTPAGR